MIRGMCVPTTPGIAPLKLAPDYRDYPGRYHERLAYLIDPIVNADCFRPRYYHAPDSSTENAGVAANGYVEYVLQIVPGSVLLGFLRSSTPVANPNNAGNPPVGSGYRCQITDVERQYKFFQKPIPEAYFLNDIPTTNPLGPYSGEDLYVLNPALRLLPHPYPVAAPGLFKVEFWNVTAAVNYDIALDFVVAEPDGQ